MAAPLVTLADLAVATEADVPVEREDFARMVLEAASDVVREAAQQPTWTRDTVPVAARRIALWLARRTFLNPDAITRSNVGPLGEATVEDYARTLELTPAERSTLLRLAPVGADTGAGSLFLQPLAKSTPVVGGTIWTPDEAGSGFPMYQAGDVGEPL